MRIWYRNLDVTVIAAWLGLVAIGLIAIYSTTHGPKAEFLLETVRQNFGRQIVWVVISLVAGTVILMLPVRFYQNAAFPAYMVCLLLLVAALLFGPTINGARSWLRIGGIGVQVSELAKVGTILAVAHLLSSRRAQKSTIRYGILTILLILVPAFVIVLQNDTGTALVFIALIPIMLFWSGFPASTVILLVSPAIAGYLAIVYQPAAIAFALVVSATLYLQTRERYVAAFAFLLTAGTTALTSFVLSRVLNAYQVARVLSFTNPEAEEYRYTVGFHLVQSKAAIGSGGIMGKGFMQGTQTQGDYIPEQSTDFIFSVIGEEYGFVGSVVVLSMYAYLLVRLLKLGVIMKHPFGAMAAFGAAGIFLVHLVVNIGMATGLLPVIGIPLPFISYGGSALLANTMMLAIVLNLFMRRDDLSIYGY